MVKDNNNNNYSNSYNYKSNSYNSNSYNSNSNNYKSNTVIGIKSPKLNDNTPGQTYFSYNQRPKLPKARLSLCVSVTARK